MISVTKKSALFDGFLGVTGETCGKWCLYITFVGISPPVASRTGAVVTETSQTGRAINIDEVERMTRSFVVGVMTSTGYSILLGSDVLDAANHFTSHNFDGCSMTSTLVLASMDSICLTPSAGTAHTGDRVPHEHLKRAFPHPKHGPQAKGAAKMRKSVLSVTHAAAPACAPSETSSTAPSPDRKPAQHIQRHVGNRLTHLLVGQFRHGHRHFNRRCIPRPGSVRTRCLPKFAVLYYGQHIGDSA